MSALLSISARQFVDPGVSAPEHFGDSTTEEAPPAAAAAP